MLGIFLAATASFAAVQDSRQVEDVPDETNVCLAIAIHWRGGDDDIRRIADVPVPASYRQHFDAGGCTRWQLQEEGLVDWHFAFGDERTTTAALAFLEGDHLRGRPAPAAYPELVAGAWRAALADLQPEAGRPAAVEGTRPSRRIQRLRSLVDAYENYVFLAQHYLRAAEFYESPALFQKARIFHAAIRGPFLLLYGDRLTPAGLDESSAARRLDLEDWHVSEFHDLEMRVAIMQARLSRDPADIDAADQILARNHDPLLSLAVAEDEERSLCDLDDDNPEVEENGETRSLRTACDDENLFVWRVIDFWRNRAMLDLLMAADPAHYRNNRGPPLDTGSDFMRDSAPGEVREYEGWKVERAVQMMTRAVADRPSGTVRENDLPDQLIALYLLRADTQVRVGALIRREHPDESENVDPESGALGDLWRAAALAPPVERPGRFRQIATRYLAVHRDIVARTANADDPGRDSGLDRKAAYFRRVLADLDRISVGE